MERLTKRDDSGRAMFFGDMSPTGNAMKIPQLLDRLAAYEDTGLEPEECAEVKKLCDDYVDVGLNVQFVQSCINAAKTGTSLTTKSWVMVESRPMDDEERNYYSEQFGYDIEYEEAVIYVSPLPDDGQEVLVCNEYGHIWIDTFSNDPDYGISFEENGDMDGIVAWMPLPEPPKEENT